MTRPAQPVPRTRSPRPVPKTSSATPPPPVPKTSLPAPQPIPRPSPAQPPQPVPRTSLRTSLLLLTLAACGDDLRAPFADDPEPARPLAPAAPLAAPCPGSDEAFAFRALRLLEGRRPLGVRELDVLASMIRQLDAAGRPGRRRIAEALAATPRFTAHWHTFLLDHLHVPRLGETSFAACHGHPGPAAESPALALHIRDHAPGEPVPADMSTWSMADLFPSALALDDLRPLLRAQLLARQAHPVGGNNVAPAELERAQRVFLGRGFEAAYLDRRLECLPCHNGTASVTDDPDPARDRSWPALPGLETAVYGPLASADEDSAYAAFRVAGVISGPLAPWGSRACGDLDPGRGGDLLDHPGNLAGPLPAGAHVLDLEARLRRGLDHLATHGLDAAVDDPEAALAGLVAQHLADAVWREASGRSLVLAHGQPRNRQQQAILRELTRELVDHDFSLRALVIAVALHPALDLGEPTACAAPLPPILDPFAAADHIDDGLRREDPWTLLDTAAHALGWRAPKRFPLPFTWEDETLLRALGVYLDDSEPGHRAQDLVAALAWERSVASGDDPGWAGADTIDLHPDHDAITRLVELARGDPDATVEDAALALHDRVLQEPDFTDASHRAEVAAVLALPLADRAASHPAADLEAALRRLAGALLMSPQFTLAGLAPPPWSAAPRLTWPETTAAALCERHAAGLADTRWRCDGPAPALAP